MTSSVMIISTSNPPGGALEKKVKKTGIFTHTIVCCNSEEVIAELKKQPVKMICWAFGPGDEQTDWLEKLKLNPAWTDLPLLVFTKENDNVKRLRGLEMGACDSVTFVTPTDELAARIRGHLKRSEQIAFLRNRRAELAQMALNDPLTGLGNRASFDLCLSQEISRSRRSGRSFGLILIDLDHFKWFNDCYGHQAGETILKAFAKTLAETVRESDIACCYGGEEFAIILPGTTTGSASRLAERLHEAIAILSQELWQNKLALTTSIGLTCFDGSRHVGSYELIGEADAALYQAKNNGRNRTEIFLPKTTQLPLHFDYNLPTTAPFQAH